jgi:Ser/Thr protein kinase RdoA (MazF antagonist)
MSGLSNGLHKKLLKLTMTTAQKTHGMSGELVAPDWPALTLAELCPLLAQFPSLGAPEAILTESPRPFSAAAQVRTAHGRVFIKRHHKTVRDAEGLSEEHRFMAHLRRHGAPAPRVFANEAGASAIEIGQWTYEVHEAPDAIDLYQDALSWTPFMTTAHAYSAGEALARLHLASEGYPAPQRQPRPLIASFSIFAAHDPYPELEKYLAARPALANHEAVRRCADRALDLLAPFHAELVPLLPALPALWTHNDLHASNLLWSGSGSDARAAFIIDFGLADRTNAVHDIAQAIERNIVDWLALAQSSFPPKQSPLTPGPPKVVVVHLDHLRALLAGYESIRPLSNAEAAALAPMTALCHAEFALSEADYFLGALHSEEKARMAYEGYLVCHAEWFSTAAGRELTAALRQWASHHLAGAAQHAEAK